MHHQTVSCPVCCESRKLRFICLLSVQGSGGGKEKMGVVFVVAESTIIFWISRGREPSHLTSRKQPITHELTSQRSSAFRRRLLMSPLYTYQVFTTNIKWNNPLGLSPSLCLLPLRGRRWGFGRHVYTTLWIGNLWNVNGEWAMLAMKGVIGRESWQGVVKEEREGGKETVEWV